ncbi:MAG: hypothetical protein ACJ71N_12400, partial [Terriglobales bacterium]
MQPDSAAASQSVAAPARQRTAPNPFGAAVAAVRMAAASARPPPADAAKEPVALDAAAAAVVDGR